MEPTVAGQKKVDDNRLAQVIMAYDLIAFERERLFAKVQRGG